MNTKLKRGGGVLMPIFSLPSNHGIGSFSKEAFEFVDALHKSKLSYWQILPINPTGDGNSPYQSYSTFAGNINFIDLESLIDENKIDRDNIENLDFGKNPLKIDYDKVTKSKIYALKECFDNSFDENDSKYQQFVKKNSFWLDDFSLYMALKEHFNEEEWTKWEYDIKIRKKSAIDEYEKKLKNSIDFYKYTQFIFFTQWHKLKKYANSKGVKIIGDIPIYVALNSSDVWVNPNLFELDKNFKPKLISGCPPDEFSKNGQLWNNPVYNWKYNKKTGYEWWHQRLEFSLKLYDVLRIDHFRGFDSFYAVKYGSIDAKDGKWYKGCGYSLFERFKGENIIAEDLGFITDSVKKLLAKSGFYGMKIFQFAVDKGKITDDIPFFYKTNSVAYTGTHDNDTIIGWYEKLKTKDKQSISEFLYNDENLNFSLIKNVLFSSSDVAVIPMADFLGKDSQARINVPGTMGENWTWRMENNEFDGDLIERIKDIIKLSLRT